MRTIMKYGNHFNYILLTSQAAKEKAQELKGTKDILDCIY